MGGVAFEHQASRLRSSGADVLVATPGRLQGLLELGVATVPKAEAAPFSSSGGGGGEVAIAPCLSLQQVQIMVLDEADRLLDVAFLDSLLAICAHAKPSTQQLTPQVPQDVPQDVPRRHRPQVLAFTATWSEDRLQAFEQVVKTVDPSSTPTPTPAPTPTPTPTPTPAAAATTDTADGAADPGAAHLPAAPPVQASAFSTAIATALAAPPPPPPPTVSLSVLLSVESSDAAASTTSTTATTSAILPPLFVNVKATSPDVGVGVGVGVASGAGDAGGAAAVPGGGRSRVPLHIQQRCEIVRGQGQKTRRVLAIVAEVYGLLKRTPQLPPR